MTQRNDASPSVGFIRVRNLERFQHYKDRNPPWIKLHSVILENYDFAQLPDAMKAHALLLVILASRLDNRIPNDPQWIATKIGARSPIDIAGLVRAKFIEIDGAGGDGSAVAGTVVKAPALAGVARARKIWSAYLESRAQIYAALGRSQAAPPAATDARMAIIEKFCLTYGEETVLAAASGLLHSDWHNGRRDGIVRASPENVFHVTSKINQVEVLADLAHRVAKGEPILNGNGKGKVNGTPAFVDRQAAMLERNAAGGKIETRPEIPTTVRLANLAASLPESLPAVGRWRREITALTGETADVERVLDAMDARMLAALRDELSAETRAAMDAKVRKAQALASKRSAEPPSEIASRIWPPLIREHYDCPKLSLFSNEAVRIHPTEVQ